MITNNQHVQYDRLYNRLCLFMSNSNPVQSQAFKDQQYQGYREDWLNEPLAKQVTGVKLPNNIHAALRSLSAEERVKYLRRVICEAVKRDLIDEKSQKVIVSQNI